MSRNFNDTTSDTINMGNVYSLDVDLAWSLFNTVKFDSFSGSDQRMVVSKFGTANKRQFHCEADTSSRITVATNNIIRHTGAALSTDTWYLVVVTNDGLNTTGSLRLYTIELVAGTVIDDLQFSTLASNASELDADIIYGGRGPSGNELDGDIGYGTLLEGAVTLADAQAYRVNANKTAARLHAGFGGTSAYHMRVIGQSPEQDLLGNGNTGTIAGTTVTDMPPVKTGYGGAQRLQFPGSGAPPAGASLLLMNRSIANYGGMRQ